MTMRMRVLLSSRNAYASLLIKLVSCPHTLISTPSSKLQMNNLEKNWKRRRSWLQLCTKSINLRSRLSELANGVHALSIEQHLISTLHCQGCSISLIYCLQALIHAFLLITIRDHFFLINCLWSLVLNSTLISFWLGNWPLFPVEP